MDRNALYTRINANVAHIVVLEDGTRVTTGSGVCCGPHGELITAAHVVTNGWPIRADVLQLPDWQIIASIGAVGKPVSYQAVYCPIVINFEMPDIAPVVIDLALLRPTDEATPTSSHLMFDPTPPKLGDEVFIAGYSEELEFPFGLDRLIAWNVEGINSLKSQFEFGIKSRIAGPMIKRGIVGNVIQGVAQQGEKTVMTVTVFFVDNHLHKGASGGPIVSAEGKVKGIIIKAAMTSEEPRVPSGSCIGLGLDALIALPWDKPIVASQS